MTARAGQGDLAVFFGAFGAPNSSERARSDHVFDAVVVPAAKRHGLAVHRADRGTAPGPLSVQIFEQLRACRVVICDITENSPSVFYELGVVHAAHLPVVLIGRETTTLPFYVKDERILGTGDSTAESDTEAVEELSDALATLLAPTSVPESVVGETLGLTGPFPPVLREALRRASVPYYREKVKYELRFTDVDTQHVVVRFGLSYRLVNRTRRDYAHHVGIVPMRPFNPVYGSIAGTQLDVNDPAHLNERGWQVLHNFPAGSATEVSFAAEVQYRMPDADIFATYLPATDFELMAEYPVDRLRLVTESMLGGQSCTPETIVPGVIRYRPTGALLAYQGFRLDWLAPRRAFC